MGSFGRDPLNKAAPALGAAVNSKVRAKDAGLHAFRCFDLELSHQATPGVASLCTSLHSRHMTGAVSA